MRIQECCDGVRCAEPTHSSGSKMESKRRVRQKGGRQGGRQKTGIVMMNMAVFVVLSQVRNATSLAEGAERSCCANGVTYLVAAELRVYSGRRDKNSRRREIEGVSNGQASATAYSPCTCAMHTTNYDSVSWPAVQIQFMDTVRASWSAVLQFQTVF